MREIYVLKLTTSKGQQLNVNAHKIVAMLPGEYGTLLVFEGGLAYEVTETPEQIKELLNGNFGLWREVTRI